MTVYAIVNILDFFTARISIAIFKIKLNQLTRDITIKLAFYCRNIDKDVNSLRVRCKMTFNRANQPLIVPKNILEHS